MQLRFRNFFNIPSTSRLLVVTFLIILKSLCLNIFVNDHIRNLRHSVPIFEFLLLDKALSFLIYSYEFSNLVTFFIVFLQKLVVDVEFTQKWCIVDNQLKLFSLLLLHFNLTFFIIVGLASKDVFC